VFWFRAPIALLTLLLLRWLPAPASAHKKAPRRFDPAGALLLATGIAFALLAPTLVQSTDTLWPALASALAGAMLLVAFARRQRGAAQPFMPRATARDPGFVLLNLSSASVHCAGFAIPLLVPYFLARISGYGPVESGAVLTVWPIGMLLGSALAASAARRFGRRPTAWLGGALVLGGQVAVGAWTFTTHPLWMLPGLLVHGAGIGLFQVAYTDIVIAALPQHDRGVAGSLTILTRTIGIMVGAAALSAGLHLAQARHLGAGLAATEAFLAAFQDVLLWSALGFAVFFTLASLRRRKPGED
jgi:Na+/melibiose symporter-like transporter